MRSGRPLQPHRWGTVAFLVAALLLPAGALAQDQAVDRVRVEAAFLRNFARYVGWPPRVFAGPRSPWLVCVLGENHFDDTLEATFQGRSEQGRTFEVLRASRLEPLAGCQIVYVDLAQATDRRTALRELKKRPVLTVGHAADFLEEGGIIRLVARERVEMSINLDQARAVALTIPSKMLEVAHEVIENGAPRRRR